MVGFFLCDMMCLTEQPQNPIMNDGPPSHQQSDLSLTLSPFFESFCVIFSSDGLNVQTKRGCEYMLQVTDTASDELTKVLAAPEHKDKKLVLYFQGVG